MKEEDPDYGESRISLTVNLVKPPPPKFIENHLHHCILSLYTTTRRLYKDPTTLYQGINNHYPPPLIATTPVSQETLI